MEDERTNCNLTMLFVSVNQSTQRLKSLLPSPFSRIHAIGHSFVLRVRTRREDGMDEMSFIDRCKVKRYKVSVHS